MESHDGSCNIKDSTKKNKEIGRGCEYLEKRRKRLEDWSYNHNWKIGGHGVSFDQNEPRDYLVVPGNKGRGVLIPWRESGISYTLHTHNNALRVQEILGGSHVLHPIFQIVNTRKYPYDTPYTVREHIDGKTLNKGPYVPRGKLPAFWKFVSRILRKNLEEAGFTFAEDIDLSRIEINDFTGARYNSADTANIDLNGGNIILTGFDLVQYLQDLDVDNLTEEKVLAMLDGIAENDGKIILFDFDDWITPNL